MSHLRQNYLRLMERHHLEHFVSAGETMQYPLILVRLVATVFVILIYFYVCIYIYIYIYIYIHGLQAVEGNTTAIA